MRYPLTALQLGLICVGALLWVTMPQDPIPTLIWRLHYAGGLWFFGVSFGVGLGIWLAGKLPNRLSP